MHASSDRRGGFGHRTRRRIAPMPRLLALAALCATLVLTAGAAGASAHAVRINQLQSLGTHNSFHVEPSAAEKAVRSGSGLVDETTLEYSFAPLWWQFAREDVRQVELDLFADPQGGAYSAPRLRALGGGGPYAPEMTRPGIKVLHVQDYDYRTTCLTLVACLRQIKGWSDDHRGHVPIAILLELKDAALPQQIPATVPL